MYFVLGWGKPEDPVEDAVVMMVATSWDDTFIPESRVRQSHKKTLEVLSHGAVSATRYYRRANDG
jgi:hypothetical protein